MHHRSGISSGSERWILDGNAIVDLNYEEDKAVTVDFNLVATEDGDFVEVQGSGEESTFSQAELDHMLTLARKGIADLIAAQRACWHGSWFHRRRHEFPKDWSGC